MRKSIGVSALNKAYKQFGKQKYNQYKLKHPHLKDAQITRRINKEWQTIGQAERDKLTQALVEAPQETEAVEVGWRKKKPLRSSSRARKPKLQQITQREQVEKPAEKLHDSRVEDESKEQVVKQPSSGEVFIGIEPKPNIESSSGVRTPHREQNYSSSSKVRESPGSSAGKVVVDRTKRIRKIKIPIDQLKNREYIGFYKFYYERLTKQHPKWNASMKTTIIGIYWKKRKITLKREAIQQRLTKKLKRPKKWRKMTGYEIFFHKKRESNPETAVSDLRKESFAIWKKLNRAGKQFYEKLAQQHNAKLDENGFKNTAVKQKKPINQPFSFLNKKID